MVPVGCMLNDSQHGPEELRRRRPVMSETDQGSFATAARACALKAKSAAIPNSPKHRMYPPSPAVRARQRADFPC